VTSVRPLVLGLDGGNTRSVAVVAGVDGEVLGTGRAGCGDIVVDDAIRALRAGTPDGEGVSVVVGTGTGGGDGRRWLTG